jgi:hypothetical protein
VVGVMGVRRRVGVARGERGNGGHGAPRGLQLASLVVVEAATGVTGASGVTRGAGVDPVTLHRTGPGGEGPVDGGQRRSAPHGRLAPVADDLPDDAAPEAAGPHELDELVEAWLTLPQVAERTGQELRTVRRMIQERQLVAVRRAPGPGEPVERCVPAQLLMDGTPLLEIPGTITLLTDAGYTDEQALRWLFTPDDTLPGSPIDALRRGHKTEVRRRAQALAF